MRIYKYANPDSQFVDWHEIRILASHRMIKAVFFDVGKVLIRDRIGTPTAHVEAAQILGIPESDSLKVFVSFIRKVAEGKMPENIFWEKFGKKFNAFPSAKQSLLKIFRKRRIVPQRYMLALARRLRKKGYIVGILSDVLPSHARIIQAAGIYKGFSPLLLSYQTGISKRRIAAFHNAARHAGVNYAEMVFLDDHDYLVAKARKLGIKAFVYKNPAQVVRSLRRLGVRV